MAKEEIPFRTGDPVKTPSGIGKLECVAVPSDSVYKCSWWVWVDMPKRGQSFGWHAFPETEIRHLTGKELEAHGL